MTAELHEHFQPEADINADNASLHRLASELTTQDALTAYRGMIQKYAEQGNMNSARELQKRTVDLWKKLPLQDQATLAAIESMIEDGQ